ncbi:MAG: glycosyltransferase [Oscillospiraceae bacterium]
MKKILFCASTVSHIRNFHLPYLRAFAQQGYEVWVAADREESVPWVEHVVALPLQKHFFSFCNLMAILRMRTLLRRVDFEAVSVHTTLAAAVVRLAAMSVRCRPRIFYTCHGYLFNDTGNLRSRAYRLVERLCAPVTDTLFVMNDEDEAMARRWRLFSSSLRRIDGMGFDRARFSPLPPDERLRLREKAGFSPEEIVLVYAAEFSARKNQPQLLRAFAAMRVPGVRLILAGTGALWEECRALARMLGVSDRVMFPGQIADMATLYPLCDVLCSASRTEGLPFHVMEAMSCGLPCAVTDIKGHRELVEHERTGLLCPVEDQESLTCAMEALCTDPGMRRRFGAAGREKSARFALDQVFAQVMGAYGAD